MRARIRDGLLANVPVRLATFGIAIAAAVAAGAAIGAAIGPDGPQEKPREVGTTVPDHRDSPTTGDGHGRH